MNDVAQNEAKRQEIFECLFLGYLEMFNAETGTEADYGFFFPGKRWVAAMYALLNLSLWDSGRKKLQAIKRKKGSE
jgi:hypothetical protein